ncbi:CMD domain-containing protein [Entomohabitans teleogrylli]|uniref:CMD domain-containing protein n=1 Tax=Entomohabitans teleogrylli TaxID=1384589 RepID=UPI00073D533D|nr:hypothetical protein [Entomohabitans teleogrylli]
MEQRRVAGKGHWYHETQSSLCHAEVLPLAPEAALVEDRLMLDSAFPAPLASAHRHWLACARSLAEQFFPARVTTDRLHTLSSYDRLSTALTVAQVYGVQRLCNHYAARLAPEPGPDSSRESNRRLTQITQYARQLASQPTLITPGATQQLVEVGLSDEDIVTFHQIIGFIGFQARLVAVAQALSDQPARWLPGMETRQDASAECFAAPVPHWTPTLEKPAPGYLSDAQLAAIRQTDGHPLLSPLSDLLALNAPALTLFADLLTQSQFSAPHGTLHQTVMLLTSRINGSADCFYQLTRAWPGDPGLPEAMRNGERALMAWCHHSPREQALIPALQIFIRTPDRFGPPQLKPFSEQGIDADTTLSLLACSALTGWINRLKSGLGYCA